MKRDRGRIRRLGSAVILREPLADILDFPKVGKTSICFGYDNADISNCFSGNQHVFDPKGVITVLICQKQLWHRTELVDSDQGKNSLFEAGPLCWGAENIPLLFLHPINILTNYNGVTSSSSSGQDDNDLTGFPWDRGGRYFYSNMVNCCATMFQCILNALGMISAATNNNLFGCTPNADLNPF